MKEVIGTLVALCSRLRSAWTWYLEAVRHGHEHEYDPETGECDCGKIDGWW